MGQKKRAGQRLRLPPSEELGLACETLVAWFSFRFLLLLPQT